MSSGFLRGRGKGRERIKRGREVKRDVTPTPVGAARDGESGRGDLEMSGINDGNGEGPHTILGDLAISTLREGT